jgi:hypothetical protein
LKHDRGENYHKATLRLLLLALGGLYILNQLFLDKKIMIRNDFFGEDVPEFLHEDTMIFATPVSTYDWNIFDKRFEMLKNQSGFSEKQVNQLKEKWMESISLKRNSYSDDSCLYSVRLIPEYERTMKAFNATMINDPIAKKSIVCSLFGNEKDIDSLLDEYGVEALTRLFLWLLL